MAYVLLDTALEDSENKSSFLFIKPQTIITCHSSDQIDACLSQLNTAVKKGLYAAGFISYEAGWQLQGLDKTKRSSSFPLLWFGLFSKPIRIKNFREAQPYLSLPDTTNYATLTKLHLNTTKNEYCQNVIRIRELIAQGKTYQVNYTMKYKFKFAGSPGNLYLQLRAIQPVSYGAFINTGEAQILSFSPELFLRRKNHTISVQPMKGTTALDQNINLAIDPKNQAENIMITDLMRNDLGKISITGSVQAYDIFRTHKYSTLWQMTSSVKSHLRPKTSWQEIFSSLFPCGSVTGAPKISTMNIIKSLEKEDRKIYTGAIGYLSPDNQAVFNVAIRTILLQGGLGEMGVGGGITFDSDPGKEWAECKLKASFLLKSTFRLIETMRWSYSTGIPLLSLHLKRLKNSAMFFGFPCNQAKISALLYAYTRALDKKSSWKIRLLLKNNGVVSLQAEALPAPVKTTSLVAISRVQTDPDDLFLRHKTTERNRYNREFKHYNKLGYYDVLFTNSRNELTEGTRTNIFIKKGRRYYTPPVRCGLLPGIYREYFIRQHHNIVKEKILCLDDLYSADAIFLTNAVRGLVQVNPVSKDFLTR
ncbi:MAG: aminodeoxychorismate synthase component I [bacterium]|nr:aminodeoxychorismate synthase component I [bacterium]